MKLEAIKGVASSLLDSQKDGLSLSNLKGAALNSVFESGAICNKIDDGFANLTEKPRTVLCEKAGSYAGEYIGKEVRKEVSGQGNSARNWKEGENLGDGIKRGLTGLVVSENDIDIISRSAGKKTTKKAGKTVSNELDNALSNPIATYKRVQENGVKNELKVVGNKIGNNIGSAVDQATTDRMSEKYGGRWFDVLDLGNKAADSAGSKVGDTARLAAKEVINQKIDDLPDTPAGFASMALDMITKK